MKNLIILILVFIVAYSSYKFFICKKHSDEIADSIEYLRKNVICSKSMILTTNIGKNSIAIDNGYLIAKNDTVKIAPHFIFNEFLAFDSLFKNPNVILFRKENTNFISIDTIKYGNFNSFEFVPKKTGEIHLYGAMIIEQYNYKIPFTFMLTFLIINDTKSVKKIEFDINRIKDYKVFQSHIDSLCL